MRVFVCAVNSCGAQIKDLKAQVARLDTELTKELERAGSLEQQLAEEKRYSTGLEAKGRKSEDLVTSLRKQIVSLDLAREHSGVSLPGPSPSLFCNVTRDILL
jgi:septal ring factor EnvC (AmiA/AmiB activator)